MIDANKTVEQQAIKSADVAPVSDVPMRTVVGFKNDNTFLELAIFEECGGLEGPAFMGEECEEIEVPEGADEQEVLALVEQYFAEADNTLGEGDAGSESDSAGPEYLGVHAVTQDSPMKAAS